MTYDRYASMYQVWWAREFSASEADDGVGLATIVMRSVASRATDPSWLMSGVPRTLAGS